MHALTGLPRSGTTLVCNILNQNNRFNATTTSILPSMLGSMSHLWSTTPEFKQMLSLHKEEMEERAVETLRAIAKTWHNSDKIVFDKSRAWSGMSLEFNQIFTDGKIICLVRDLRNVFASVEKQHRKNPILNQEGKTIYERADTMFGPTGLIGGPITGVEDLLRRDPKNVIFIKYEDLVSEPLKIMTSLYKYLGYDYFEHNFENVKNTAEDPDFMYLNKYPHKGEGKVTPCDLNEWKKYVSDDLAETIMGRFTNYNKNFGYK